MRWLQTDFLYLTFDYHAKFSEAPPSIRRNFSLDGLLAEFQANVRTKPVTGTITMDAAQHWEQIYRTKAPTDVSWYQPEARLSLDLIQRVMPDRAAPVIDVGGGASTLVDGLLGAGYRAVTVLDLAPTALTHAQDRLGADMRRVTWIASDVLRAPLPAARYAVWHDRAVFHFLTSAEDRARYVAQVRRAVRPGGHVIVASFGPDGPTRCSGLEVVRYTPEAMHAEFGAGFQSLDSVRETHHTPSGAAQAFVYCLYRVERPLTR